LEETCSAAINLQHCFLQTGEVLAPEDLWDLGNSLHHVRNSEDFTHTLGTLWVEPNDVLASFDIISLFVGYQMGIP